jgi:preprotein translocase subunit SecF
MSGKTVPIISKFYAVYFAISLCVLIPGILSLVIFRLQPGIDFTGGTAVEFSAKAKDGSEINKNTISQIVGKSIVQEFHADPKGTYRLRLLALDDTKRAALSATLSASLKDYKETSLTSIGPTIGSELIVKTLTAVGIASAIIMVYLAFRFQSLKLGICAILATLHDVLILLGVFSILGKMLHVEVDLLFVTALLTIVSFSVHDTVIVYDRIRERRKKILREPFLETIDASVLQTLTRSLRNAGAVVITLLALFVLGGETLRWFAFALLVGTISGTYSSTFVALPLLVVWENATHRK